MKLWDDELEGYREEARALLEYLPDIWPDQLPSDPVVRARAQRESMRAAAPVELSELAEESSIPGPDGDIPVRIFRPEGPAKGLYLHLHGGGWILGDPTMGDLSNEHLATDFGLAVLSVDYRLAPEHPYPAGPDDCEAAARWLLEKGPSEFGAERMFIGGESAGGHLSLVTALRTRDRLGAVDRLLGLNLVFGWYDVNGTPSQRGNGGHKDMLDPEGLRFMVDCFTPGLSEEERRDPDISPLFADLSGLPPCLLSVGGFDHLRDDTLFLAPLLAAAGVDTELAVYPDSPHGFMALPSEMAKAHARRLDSWIERVLAD
jgi:acetyl esterase/lipase